MLTKNKAKLIKSLSEKKYRTEHGLFLVEGRKSIEELLNSDFKIEHLLITKEFYSENSKIIKEKNITYDISEQGEIEKVSSFESNDSALAVVYQKENTEPQIFKDEIILALDDIRDPGNLGTIIRIADWYGVTKIIASKTTVDQYNPKTISATKGSFTRVQIFYTELGAFLSKTSLATLGAFLDGENVHTSNFPTSGILIMGNESNGICKDVEKFVSKKITIPSYGKAESLNVGIATAVVLDNWRRDTK